MNDSAPFLSILGIGEDGTLSARAAALVGSATLVVGGSRHLALAGDRIAGERMVWPSPIADILPTILARRPQPVAVLASGDPFCFGVGPMLAEAVPDFLCLPAPSSPSLACARLGWAAQEVAVISFCGRPMAPLAPLLHRGAHVLALSAGAATPAELAAFLRARGFGPSRMAVLEALGGPRERRRDCTAESFAMDDVHPLNLVAIDVIAGPDARVIPLAPGLDDGLFAHDGQLTKCHARAMTLAALAPRRGELLWDIGTGSGAVAIEWLLRHRANRAIGIDRNADRIARAAANAETTGTPELRLIRGEAPDCLAGLPAPDAIFVGGGASRVLEPAWDALRPGGRLVANTVTIEGEAALVGAQGRHGGSLTRLAVARLDRIGALHGFRPAMTVTQWAATKGEPMIVAGIGCRRACPPADIAAALREAERAAGCRATLLAIPAFKHMAPAALDLPVIEIDDASMVAAQPSCLTFSARARAATGLASVAEAAALAGAGAGSRLLGPRVAHGAATCALAESAPV